MLQVENIANEEIPQIYAVCGRGSRSSLRVLRPGLAVTEMAVSPLPGNPTAVWTTRRSNTSEFDNYIIVSFINATLVQFLITLSWLLQMKRCNYLPVLLGQGSQDETEMPNLKHVSESWDPSPPEKARCMLTFMRTLPVICFFTFEAYKTDSMHILMM